MGDVIILRGAPGAGKSSLARLFQLLNGPATAVVSADAYVFADGNQWSPERLQEGHSRCWAQFILHLKNKVPVIIVDNTNQLVRDYERYWTFAEMQGYNVRHIVVENRHQGQNAHNCPPEVVERARRRIMSDLML